MPTLDTWRFHLGEALGAEAPAYDDSSWREVFVPHDWSIEGDAPFTPDTPGKGAIGHVSGGIGWYRTRVKLDPTVRHRLVFQGAYLEAQVWVDGIPAARHLYGYTPFEAEIPAGKSEAVVTVRVDNPGHNSRWYTGAGLYRPVILERLGSAAIRRDGLFALPDKKGKAWTVQCSAQVDAVCDVRFTVLDPNGTPVGEATASGTSGLARTGIAVDKPRLWNPWDSPKAMPGEQPRYTLRAEALGETPHSAEVRFGFREVEYGQNGLFVNGERILLKGGCIHHDHGVLGSAAHDLAEIRKVRLLKEAGYNAIRTSHNPPSEALLEACDRFGLLVIDEVHDEWEVAKTPQGYHRHFIQHAEEDARDMVRRDRNRPSVWCWSIGNEIPGCYERPDLALKLRQAVLSEDPSRPITAGLCPPWWKDPTWKDWRTSAEPACRHLDIVGMNYLWAEVRPDHDAYPERLVMQTETYALEAYDCWKSVTECPWNFGDFVWTAQDYRGEAGIGQSYAAPEEPRNGAFPFHLAVCGDLDLIGERKPQSYHRESLWQPGVLRLAVHVPAEIARPKIAEGWMYKWGWDEVREHWNWPGFEDKPLEVEIATSASSVQLFLNGELVADRVISPEDKGRARVKVPYRPGVLEARAGEQSFQLVTAGPAARLSASIEDSGPHPGDLSFVRVEVQDDSGVRVPDASHLIRARIEGPAVLAGFGNADPVDIDPVQDEVHRAFRGACLLVRRRMGTGEAKVRLEADGLIAWESVV